MQRADLDQWLQGRGVRPGPVYTVIQVLLVLLVLVALAVFAKL